MKNILKASLFIVIIFLSITVYCQDKIYLANGQLIKAKVTVVGKSDVEYKKFDNIEGPEYFVSKDEIVKIVYENGAEDVFNGTSKGSGAADKSAGGATSSISPNDVLGAGEFVFYGLDFSNFSLVEEKRVGQAEEIKTKYFPAWNKYFEEQIGLEKLKKWMGKSDVSYNPDPVGNVNSSCSSEKTVVANRYGANLDNMPALIAQSVSNYTKGGANYKIGFVINVQYFDKATSEAAAFFTFFDTETNAVISSKRVAVKKVEGNGLTNYWGTSLIYLVKDYVDKIYKKGYL